MKRTTTFLLLIIGTIACFAQYPPVRNFNNIEYNSGTQNWGISHGSDGRVLFANNNGMLTFDSDKWLTYPLPNYTAIHAVLFDYDRHVIFTGGTNEFGYFEADPNDYSLRFHSLMSLTHEQNPDVGEIWNIMRLGHDVVFQSKEKLLIYHNNNTLTIISSKYWIESSAVIDDRLFLGCKEGLFELKRGKIVPVDVTGYEKLTGNLIRSILPFEGKIMIATATGGLYLYDGKEIAPYTLDVSPFLIANNLFCAETDGKNLVFGTVRNGAVVKNLQTNTNYYINAETGLQNNTVLSASFDRTGNIWLGLNNGVSYVAIDAPYLNLLGANSHIGTGYASVIWGSKLYLGTNQGLFTLDYPTASGPISPLPQSVGSVSGQIWDLQHIDGTLFCGCDNGAYIIRGGQAEKIDGPKGTWTFRELKHHPGYILACDYQGFYLLKKSGASWVMEHRLTGYGESTATFEEDADGTIWASHWQKGVWHLRLKNDLSDLVVETYYGKANQLPNDYSNILCKMGNKVYISSTDGFRCYDGKTRKLVRVEMLDKLFGVSGEALKVMEIPSGDLWAYRGNYLAIARKKPDNSFAVDSISYGGITNQLQMSLGSIGIYDDKHTIINHNNGFYVVNNVYKNTPQKYPLIIRSVQGTTHGDTLLYAKYPMDTENTIKVPKSQNSIRIEFVLPEYREAKSVTYTCYLKGYDKEWNLPTTNTYKEYTQLPKGHYTFIVKAKDNINGLEAESSLDIEILPAWYETWYAGLFYLLLLAVIIYYLIRYMKSKAETELRRIKIEKERQLQEQEVQFTLEQAKQEKELVKLQNKQLEHELKLRSSELADSTMNLVRKNDMLQVLDENMVELSESVRREDAKAKITKKINDIRRDIQSNMNDDANWEKFEENFNLVYDNFMVKLLQKYPDLKKNDRKLCAYLRMGLSSKEMASLMNTSVRSIETARYRLRKKLDLPTGDNLTEFIQQFEKS